jgi:hypothetical protein
MAPAFAPVNVSVLQVGGETTAKHLSVNLDVKMVALVKTQTHVCALPCGLEIIATYLCAPLNVSTVEPV